MLDIIFAIIVMIVVFTSPASAVTALLWIIGVYVIVFGIFPIPTASTARSQAKRAMKGCGAPSHDRNRESERPPSH
ncbi:DUF308 domain-containing protein, partial [Vibrio cholerae O1]|nr:DUF308 domain-containing protein [Vibrio cholerae O1]